MPADGGMQGGSGGRGEAANQDDMTESLSAVLKALISLLILFAPAHPPYVYVKLCSRRDSSLQNIFRERECKQWIIKLMHSKMIANNPFNPCKSDGQISFKKVEKRGSQDSSLCHGIHFPFMLLHEMGFFSPFDFSFAWCTCRTCCSSTISGTHSLPCHLKSPLSLCVSLL